MAFTTAFPAFTPVPLNWSFYANVTYGTISNADTSAYVVLSDNVTGTPVFWKSISLNDTINAAKVVTLNNAGVITENYTWLTAFNKTTLACTEASCADVIPATNDPFIVTAFVSENVASLGGGLAAANVSSGVILVSTFVSAGFISPVTSTGFAFPEALAPIPAPVEFFTNISWGWTQNATAKNGWAGTNVSLQILSQTDTVLYSFSFNGTLNTTTLVNGINLTSAPVFNGTVFSGVVDGVFYSSFTFSLVLNQTALGCSTYSCQVELGTGEYVTLQILVNESGTSAGGLASTGDIPAFFGLAALPTVLGSTLIDGFFTSPTPLQYQPLPFVQTGYMTVSWTFGNTSLLAPAGATITSPGNATISGSYLLVYDNVTGLLLANLSFDGSVNTTNAYGISFMPVPSASTLYDAKTKSGLNFTTYDWTIVLNASLKGWTVTTVPYDPLYIVVQLNVTGAGYGGVVQTTGQFPLYFVPVDLLAYSTYLPIYEVLYPVVTPYPAGMGNPIFVQYPTTVTGTFTSTFSAYMPIPFNVNYTLTVTNAPISPLTTTILVNVTDLTAAQLLTSTPITPIPGQTQYVFPVDAATLLCNTPSCSGLPSDEFGISVFVGIVGAGLPTNGSIAAASTSHSFFLIPVPLSAKLVSPAPGASVSIGNVTVSVAYLGSWTAGAVLNIYSSTNALVFSHSFVELTPGVPVSQTWFIGQTGTYSYSIVMTTVYLPTTHYFNGTINVITKGGTVFTNTTKYSNQSAISGLSGAASGTILLVVGLIVGMIVAFVLARAVMGRPAAAPPQPWESKPGAPGGAPNTCSVCGKTFSTPEELAAHGKSEHGMQ